MKSSEKKSDQLAVLLDDAERLSAQLEPKKEEDVLREADGLLKDPELQLSPDREIYASRYAELIQKLNEVREARRAKDIEEAVRSERAEIGPSLQTMKDAADALASGKFDDKLLDSAREAVAALEKAVAASDDRRVFALKDPSFVGYLKRTKAETERARAEVTKGEKKQKFFAGPVALKTKAAQDLKDSKSEKDLEKKRLLVASAASGFGQCLTTGLEFVKGGFAGEKLAIGGATTSVESFLESCKSSQASTELTLKKLPKPKVAKAAAKKK